MKILIDNVEHELDVEQAQKFGCIKKVYVPVSVFRPGDIFEPFGESNKHRLMLIIKTKPIVDEWLFISVDNGSYSLTAFGTSEISKPLSTYQALNYLREERMVFKKNIADDIEKLAKS